jgi:hypothetical protein
MRFAIFCLVDGFFEVTGGCDNFHSLSCRQKTYPGFAYQPLRMENEKGYHDGGLLLKGSSIIFEMAGHDR